MEDGARGGAQPAADREGTDQPVCEEESTSEPLQRSLRNIRLMPKQLREICHQEGGDSPFQPCIAALEEPHEETLGGVPDFCSPRTASIEDLDATLRDWLEKTDNIHAALESDGSGSDKDRGQLHRLDIIAALLQRVLRQVERRRKELDSRQNAIEVRMSSTKVEPDGQSEAAGHSGTQVARSAYIGERGRALHQDDAEPPRTCDVVEQLSLAWSVGEPSPHPSQSGKPRASPTPDGRGDHLLVKRMAPLTFRMDRKILTPFKRFGSLGVLEGEFLKPTGLATNSDGNIIVADSNNHRVQVFGRDGRYIRRFGQQKNMYFPIQVAVAPATGEVIVIERAPAHRVLVFHLSGRFIRKFGSLELRDPTAVAVDPLGRLVVIERCLKSVLIFQNNGKLLRKFICTEHVRFPNGVAVNAREEIFISDHLAHSVKVFTYGGTYLRVIGGAGVTNFPFGVCVTGSGEVLVADNHRAFKLTVFDQDGALLRAYESDTKHTDCLDVAWMEGGSVVLATRDCTIHMYRLAEAPRAPADASPTGAATFASHPPHQQIPIALEGPGRARARGRPAGGGATVPRPDAGGAGRQAAASVRRGGAEGAGLRHPHRQLGRPQERRPAPGAASASQERESSSGCNCRWGRPLPLGAREEAALRVLMRSRPDLLTAAARSLVAGGPSQCCRCRPPASQGPAGGRPAFVAPPSEAPDPAPQSRSVAAGRPLRSARGVRPSRPP